MNALKPFICGVLLFAVLGTGCAPASSAEPAPTKTPETKEDTQMETITEKVKRLMSMRDLEEIFALEDNNDLAIALFSALGDWSEYGQRLDALSHEAKVFYLCDTLDIEVNSDGFVGFFFQGSYGRHAPETVDALETLGAPETAKLLRQAIALLPDGVCPTDDDEREAIFFTDVDGYSDAYYKLDQAFYRYPDGLLTEKYVAYAKAHADAFSPPKET